MVHVRPGHDVRVVLRHVLDAPPLRVRQLLLAHLDGARVVAVLQLERDEVIKHIRRSTQGCLLVNYARTTFIGYIYFFLLSAV